MFSFDFLENRKPKVFNSFQGRWKGNIGKQRVDSGALRDLEWFVQFEKREKHP